MEHILDFEKPVYALENQIKELQNSVNRPGIDLSKEIQALQTKVDQMIQEIYKNLTSWERVQLARHAQRPHASDYIENIVTDFCEIHGDRRFFDDAAMITGFGYIDGKKVAIAAIEKGRKTQDKIKRNFGMPHPEGYRKALRLMRLAEQFQIPIVTFVDTPGAYPGVGAEERGQALAIAENIQEMFSLKVPIMSIVIGEGGSGGALGIAVADWVAMLEYSIYSVISPESCASILWSDPKMAESAANSLKLHSHEALKLKVVDELIAEPAGGAHRVPEIAYQTVKSKILASMNSLSKIPLDRLVKERTAKFRAMGNSTIK